MTDAWAPFEAIDEHTPSRYRFWLAKASDLSRALEVPDASPAVDIQLEADGRLVVTANGTLGIASFHLRRLRDAGIEVRGVEAVGVIANPPDEVVARLVDGWRRFKNSGPARRRLEHLAGRRALEWCIAAELERPDVLNPYSFAGEQIALNTPGTEGRLLEVASTLADSPNWDPSVSRNWLEAARARIRLSEAVGHPIDFQDAHLIRFIGHPDLGYWAAEVAAALPAPLSPAVTEALCRAVAGGDRDVAEQSARALQRAAPSSAVRATLELALRSDAAKVREPAMAALAAVWGADARPFWRELLRDRSTDCRFRAESVMAQHGDASDLPDVVTALGRILRGRGPTGYMPKPRGGVLVDFLASHRDHPEAAPGLADIRARWGHMPPDLQDWIARHHPELAPDRADLPSPGPDVSPVVLERPALTGPDAPPFKVEELDDDDATHTLSIDETAAHEEEDRIERFVARLTAMPGVTAFHEDRELIFVNAPRLTTAALVAAVDQAWAASVDDAEEAPHDA